jgi:hypothetical protein
MATKLKIEKRGNEIKKKTSPLKLLSQSQPNFAKMILGWSPSKIASGISNRRRLKCEKLTTDDDERNLMAIAHMAFGQVS